jgi:uncharacterized LabA/DUF88 family protein
VSDEIALFIDFENIRYSLINVQRREPDPQELIGVARRFGTVMVARAYADWQRQPEFFKGSLTAAMIDRIDCPAKVRERFRQPPAYNASYNPAYSQPSAYDRLPARDQQLDQQLDQHVVGDEYVEEEQPLAAQESVVEETVVQEGEQPEEAGARDEEGEQPEEEMGDERRGRYEQPAYGNAYGNGYPNSYGGNYSAAPGNSYGNGYGNSYPGNYPGANGNSYGSGGYYPQPQQVITQSTVDLNMLMDIIETVFDRPSINTFVLMTGDRDFTRISARLKLRLNKRVIVVGVPSTVSRDLITAADQFIPLGVAPSASMPGGSSYYRHQQPYQQIQGPVEPDEAGFIQFLDYIDRHWSWRTVGGVANFIGDAFNPKNRFRGRLTRDSARDLLRVCIDEGILILGTDAQGSENLRLNREHQVVVTVLSETPIR